MEMVQPIPTRALSRARGLSMRTHLTGPAVDPEVAILGADQKERGLWGRECLMDRVDFILRMREYLNAIVLMDCL